MVPVVLAVVLVRREDVAESGEAESQAGRFELWVGVVREGSVGGFMTFGLGIGKVSDREGGDDHRVDFLKT